MDPSWIDDPRLADINRNKLEFLNSLAFQNNYKSIADLFPILLNSIENEKNPNITFTEIEVQKILEVLKTNKSAFEIKRLNKIIALFRNFHI